MRALRAHSFAKKPPLRVFFALFATFALKILSYLSPKHVYRLKLTKFNAKAAKKTRREKLKVMVKQLVSVFSYLLCVLCDLGGLFFAV